MDRLARILEKIRRFYRVKRRMPSYRELAGLAGYHSTNAVSKLVNRLIENGSVTRDPASGKLLPQVLWGQVRILGSVEAGFPSPAEEELVDTLTLDEYLIRNREATFMLKVSGDSMIEAGILPGDLVLVERGADPRDGDVVIAQIDGAWTMKFFKKENGRVWLKPGNSKYKAFLPKEELNISAVVRAVVRRY